MLNDTTSGAGNRGETPPPLPILLLERASFKRVSNTCGEKLERCGGLVGVGGEKSTRLVNIIIILQSVSRLHAPVRSMKKSSQGGRLLYRHTDLASLTALNNSE